MSKVVVLVLLESASEDARPFRQAIEADETLRERVELRFARGVAAQEAIRDAEIAVCGNLAPELLAAADRLRWISFWSAGLDNKVTPELAARNLLLTSANGIHGPNIAEHLLMFMLILCSVGSVFFGNRSSNNVSSG